jgi:hypothetical protein
MTKPVFIPEASVSLPASTCASIRHGLNRDRQIAIRNGERIPGEVVAAIEMIDLVGSAWEKKSGSHVSSDVSSDVSSLPSESFESVRWISVKTAAEQLEITPQAVTGLLGRRSLNGEKTGRAWRVDAASVAARKDAHV